MTAEEAAQREGGADGCHRKRGKGERMLRNLQGTCWVAEQGGTQEWGRIVMREQNPCLC